MNGIRAPAHIRVGIKLVLTQRRNEMSDNLFDFDLQRFGDDAGDSAGADNASDNKPKTDPADDKQDDTQAKIDAAVTARLADEKAKWEKEYQKKAAADKKEAERLAKLSEDERRAAELEARNKELEEKDREIRRKELKLETVKVLADRSLPVAFADYLIAEDSESTLKRITAFEKEYKKAVEAGVNEKLKGKAPAASGGGAGDSAGVENGFFKAIYDNQAKR
nr:MAG TPA: Major capsid protein [Caudoviricetes sp.]